MGQWLFLKGSSWDILVQKMCIQDPVPGLVNRCQAGSLSLRSFAGNFQASEGQLRSYPVKSYMKEEEMMNMIMKKMTIMMLMSMMIMIKKKANGLYNHIIVTLPLVAE